MKSLCQFFCQGSVIFLFPWSDHLRFVTGYMTVDINCTRHSRNVCRHCFNIQTDERPFPPKPWGPIPSLFIFKHFVLKICVKWIWVVGIQRTHQCFLCKKSTFVKGSADSDSDYLGGHGLGPAVSYYFQNEILDSLKSCRRLKHTDHTHILLPKPFGPTVILTWISRNDLCIDHSRCVISCISATYGILYYRFS